MFLRKKINAYNLFLIFLFVPFKFNFLKNNIIWKELKIIIYVTKLFNFSNHTLKKLNKVYDFF